MGYDASLEIRKSTGELLTAKKEKQLKKSMETLEFLQDLILETCARSVRVCLCVHCACGRGGIPVY